MWLLEQQNYSIKLEIHETKDIADNHVNGSLTIIWKDYDNIIKNNPKMVYVSSVNPKETKGPHIHTRRNSYFSCIHGSVMFIIKNLDGSYTEIESSAENGLMVFIPKNIASAQINTSIGISRILVLADLAWKPNDNEMHNTTFDNYDWEKWQ